MVSPHQLLTVHYFSGKLLKNSEQLIANNEQRDCASASISLTQTLFYYLAPQVKIGEDQASGKRPALQSKYGQLDLI